MKISNWSPNRVLMGALVTFVAVGVPDAAVALLELTREGRPRATIVVARNPARAALWAAHDLQRHVQMITGATLPIRADGIAVEGRRILVGESVATRAMGIKAEDFKKQEYLIRFLPDTLVLMGRDDKRADTGMKPGVVVTGEPKWTDGRFGRGLAFQGGEAVTVSRFQFPDAEGTLEAWVWVPSEPSATNGTILRLDGSDPWSYHIVQRQVNTRRIQYVTYVEQPKSSGSVVSKELAAGWHHVAATYSVKTGRIELFVDGVSQGVGKYAMTTCDGSALQIGGIARAGAQVANPLTGKVDEIRISSVLRVPPKDAPAAPVAPDGDTRLLMHLDEG
ncbi:MAG: LamG domain-containing protein, partial [Planctomycetes bacterium]|nr:LamG domain-containing protein [Planctomycetota bacterium]